MKKLSRAEKIDWVRHSATDKEIDDLLGESDSYKFSDRGYRCLVMSCGGAAIGSWTGLGLMAALVGGLAGLVFGIWVGWFSKKSDR
jgi:hypothetical protein